MIQQILCNVQIYVLLLKMCHEYILQGVIFILQGVLSTMVFIYDTDYSSKQLSQLQINRFSYMNQNLNKHTHTHMWYLCQDGQQFQVRPEFNVAGTGCLTKKKRRKQQMKAVQH